VIVDDFDILYTSFTPPETDSPLLIDANAPLPGPSTTKLFQAICRRHSQIADGPRLVKHE
jgi:hypothetical protein